MKNRVFRGVTKWTPELDQKLIGLFEYGLRKEDVAEEMGMTIATVEGRYYRLRKMKEENNVR